MDDKEKKLKQLELEVAILEAEKRKKKLQEQKLQEEIRERAGPIPQNIVYSHADDNTGIIGSVAVGVASVVPFLF